jgi:hypothetical protein
MHTFFQALAEKNKVVELGNGSQCLDAFLTSYCFPLLPAWKADSQYIFASARSSLENFRIHKQATCIILQYLQNKMPRNMLSCSEVGRTHTQVLATCLLKEKKAAGQMGQRKI